MHKAQVLRKSIVCPTTFRPNCGHIWIAILAVPGAVAHLLYSPGAPKLPLPLCSFLDDLPYPADVHAAQALFLRLHGSMFVQGESPSGVAKGRELNMLCFQHVDVLHYLSCTPAWEPCCRPCAAPPLPYSVQTAACNSERKRTPCRHQRLKQSSLRSMQSTNDSGRAVSLHTKCHTQVQQAVEQFWQALSIKPSSELCRQTTDAKCLHHQTQMRVPASSNNSHTKARPPVPTMLSALQGPCCAARCQKMNACSADAKHDAGPPQLMRACSSVNTFTPQGLAMCSA